ncbi:hypothetical protein [Haloarcula sp. CBA1127]|nr:hypothetical protein [Haloarcula sp. CBA1127]
MSGDEDSSSDSEGSDAESEPLLEGQIITNSKDESDSDKEQGDD